MASQLPWWKRPFNDLGNMIAGEEILPGWLPGVRPRPSPTPPPPPITKDDLEAGRNAEDQGTVTTTDTFIPPPTPPHIRYTLPDPFAMPRGEGMPESPESTYIPGPMLEHSYIPDETTDIADTLSAGDWGKKLGGFMGTPPNVAGGAYSPSQPWDGLSPESRAQFPSYWEGRAQTLGELTSTADEARLKKLIEDPMWEEKQKAEIWAQAQGKAQFAIWDNLMKAREEDIRRIVQEVEGMDNLSPAQKQKEIQDRIAANDDQKGYGMFMNTTRLPNVTGFPSLTRGKTPSTKTGR